MALVDAETTNASSPMSDECTGMMASPYDIRAHRDDNCRGSVFVPGCFTIQQ